MSLWARFTCLIAGAGLAVGSLVASAPPADAAACTIPVTGPTKWVIDGTDTNYKYTAKPTCSTYDWDASANVYGPNSTYKDYSFIWAFKGSATDIVPVDDWTKPGKYVFGSKEWYAYDGNYDDVYVSGMPTPTIYAKYASRARISGTRSGSKVRLSGNIKRYCDSCINGYDEGYTKRSGTVLLQRKKSESQSWYTFKTLSNVNGSWNYTASLARKHYFRAVVRQNSTSWSSNSNRIYR